MDKLEITEGIETKISRMMEVIFYQTYFLEILMHTQDHQEVLLLIMNLVK